MATARHSDPPAPRPVSPVGRGPSHGGMNACPTRRTRAHRAGNVYGAAAGPAAAELPAIPARRTARHRCRSSRPTARPTPSQPGPQPGQPRTRRSALRSLPAPQSAPAAVRVRPSVRQPRQPQSGPPCGRAPARSRLRPSGGPGPHVRAAVQRAAGPRLPADGGLRRPASSRRWCWPGGRSCCCVVRRRDDRSSTSPRTTSWTRPRSSSPRRSRAGQDHRCEQDRDREAQGRPADDEGQDQGHWSRTSPGPRTTGTSRPGRRGSSATA